jgi:hypothetical protein
MVISRRQEWGLRLLGNLFLLLDGARDIFETLRFREEGLSFTRNLSVQRYLRFFFPKWNLNKSINKDVFLHTKVNPMSNYN